MLDTGSDESVLDVLDRWNRIRLTKRNRIFPVDQRRFYTVVMVVVI